MIKNAVILARGLGTRMRRAADGVELGTVHADLAERGLKVLMPIAGRPFLDYIVDSLLTAGVKSVCFVVAPEAQLMRHAADRIAEKSGAKISCAIQQEPLGTADAVLAAEECVGDEPFILCNGDNLYPAGALRQLTLGDPETCAVVAFDQEAMVLHGNIARERARDFAIVQSRDDGILARIVEKPPDPDAYRCDGRLWVSMNLYRFTPAIFEYCREVTPDPVRGELELTAAVDAMADAGWPEFRVLRCEEGVFDLTSRADIPSAARALAGRVLSF